MVALSIERCSYEPLRKLFCFNASLFEERRGRESLESLCTSLPEMLSSRSLNRRKVVRATRNAERDVLAGQWHCRSRSVFSIEFS